MNDLYQIGCISYYFFVIGQPPPLFFSRITIFEKKHFFCDFRGRVKSGYKCYTYENMIYEREQYNRKKN